MSGQKLATAYVEIRAQLDQLQNDLKGGTGIVRSWLGSVQGLTSMLGVGLGLNEIRSTLGEALAAYEEATNNAASLKAVLDATGNSAGYTFDQLMEMSAELQTKTTIADDAWQNVMQTMLRFNKVTGAVFKEAVEMSGDLAIAMGNGPGGARQAAALLGQALQDPVRGMTRLRRAGISFTEDQKKQIKEMVKSGNLLGAQQILLREITVRAKGAAAALAQTPVGKLAQARNELGDIYEVLGEKVLPVYLSLVNLQKAFAQGLIAVIGYVTPIVTWIDKMGTAFMAADAASGGWYSSILIGTIALGGLAIAMRTLPIGAMLSGIASLAGGFYRIIAAASGLITVKGIIAFFTKGFFALQLTLGITVGLVRGLAMGLVGLLRSAAGLFTISGAWNAIVFGGRLLLSLLGGLVTGFLGITSLATAGAAIIGGGLVVALIAGAAAFGVWVVRSKEVQEAIGRLWLGIKYVGTVIYNAIVPALSEMWTAFQTTFGGMMTTLTGWKDSATSTLAGWITGFADGLMSMGEMLAAFITNWRAIPGIMEAAFVYGFLRIVEIAQGAFMMIIRGAWQIAKSLVQIFATIGLTAAEAIRAAFTGDGDPLAYFNDRMAENMEQFRKGMGDAFKKSFAEGDDSKAAKDELNRRMQPVLDTYAKLKAAREEALRKLGEKPPEADKPKTGGGGGGGGGTAPEGPIAPKGFVGFEELNKKMQDALLKADDPTGKLVDLTAAGNKVQEDMLAVAKETRDKMKDLSGETATV